MMTNDIRFDSAQIVARALGSHASKITDAISDSRPQLPHPDVVTRTEKLSHEKLMSNILEIVLEVHEMSLKNRKETLDYTIDDLRMEQERLELEQFEAQRRQQTAGFWGFLKKVAVYVFSAISIAVGGVMAAIGGPAGIVAGSLMMASGAAAITSQILADAGINSKLTGALAVAGAVMGLVGSGVSFAVLANSIPALISTIAASVANVTEGSMTIGTAIAMHEANKAEAHVIGVKQKVSLDQADMKWIADAVRNESKKLINSEQNFVEEASRLSAFAARMGQRQIAG